MTSKPPFPRLSLLKRRLLIAATVLLVVALGLVLPFPFDGRVWGEIFDLAHAFVFFSVLLALVGLCDPSAVGFRRRCHQIVAEPNRPLATAILIPMTLARIGVVVASLMLLGLIAEFLQKFAGRNPSWLDIAANLTGLMAGTFWLASSRVSKSARIRWRMAAIGLLIAISLKPVLNLWDCVQQIRSWPMLASFERPLERGNWATRRATLVQSREWATVGESSGKVKLLKGRYPGIMMTWFQRDWSNMERLELDLRNGSQFSQTIVLKIFDQQHAETGFASDDRFERAVQLAGGETTRLRIPLEQIATAPASRRLDISCVWALELFSLDLEQPAVLMLDRLILIPKAAGESPFGMLKPPDIDDAERH